MGSLNSVTIIGNLGKDPELKTTNSGLSVCHFTVATSETWKDKQTGEKKQSTEWHSISVWGAQAEHCAKYLAKGRSCCVQGSIHTRSYEKDGTKKYITEIKADRVTFLGSSTMGAHIPGSAQEPTGDGIERAKEIARALKKGDEDLAF